MCMPGARVFNSDETATGGKGRLWPPNGGCLEKLALPSSQTDRDLRESLMDASP